MEFLDFLRYGALGVSLALAILSFRLLSKEQDKADVRNPILNTIKLYFVFALVLSGMFAFVEILPGLRSDSNSYAKRVIGRIWKLHFEGYPDSTMVQKISRISDNISTKTPDTSAICKAFIQNHHHCTQELEKYEKGFYPLVVKLQHALNKDADGWINIGYQTENKMEVIQTLKGLFGCLGQDYDELSAQEIVDKWKRLKSQWSDTNLNHIFRSDITEMVKLFIQTYS